ncbi:ATP-dependent helicase [Salmonella enterica subsp. enterica]|uniref:ATP-dependent helicase n=1 Tax=Salmonella enterica I TaxID=59201 RepID=A0A447MVK6_SALET|nr:ATP-dependent helicase [Salmonella enterica subsp. enterica]
MLWRSVPHIIVTSATLRSLNSFSRLQEMSGLKEKAGDRFVALDSPFNHVEQGKLVIPQMRYEPTIDNEEQHIAEMAAYFREQLESKKTSWYAGTVRQRAGDAAVFWSMSLMYAYSSWSRATSRVTGWWSCTVNGWRAANVALLVGLQSFCRRAGS